MTILVTGASGFAGSHLLKFLRLQQDDHCVGLTRSLTAEADTVSCDLINRNQVDTILKNIKPAFIYHMAGSFSNNYETDFNSNVLCAKNLLDSVTELKIPTRILLMGSAAEYGEVEENKNPITEEQALHPISIYGWTKASQSQLASLYFKTCNIEVMVARTFNLTGEGISEKLFIGRIKKQIDAVLSGREKRISVGNVDTVRDYLDINRACEMYQVIATRGSAGEIYNVASGKPVIMRDLLKTMLSDAGLDYSVVDEMSYIKTSTTKETSVSYACIDKYKKLISA